MHTTYHIRMGFVYERYPTLSGAVVCRGEAGDIAFVTNNTGPGNV